MTRMSTWGLHLALVAALALASPAATQQGGTDGGQNGGTDGGTGGTDGGTGGTDGGTGGTDGGSTGGNGTGSANGESAGVGGNALGSGAFAGAASSGKGTSGAPAAAASRTVTAGAATCKRLSPAYRVDCYRLVLLQAANQLNGKPGYEEAQKALAKAAADLGTVVNRNADRKAPLARAGSAKVRAVSTAAVEPALRQTEAVLAEAQTVLLRAADKSNVHYARIADAVGSMKVLLRSALLPDTGATRHA